MIPAVKICLIFIGVLFISGAGIGQSAVRLPFSKKISIDEGLSSYNVKKILQDKYGFIWIVTQDGLNRYDGKEFRIYNKSSDKDHQLLASDIWDVEEDTSRNMLWVVTSYGGLNAIDLISGKISRALPAKSAGQGFSHEWLRCLRLYKNDLWIGTYDGLSIYNVVKQAYEWFEPLPFKKLANNNFCIDKLFIDAYNHIWLFVANYGIVVYSGTTRKIISCYSLDKLLLENKPTFKQFNAVIALPDGMVLAGTNQGFRRIAYTSTGIHTSSTGLSEHDSYYSHTSIEAAGVDSAHHIWFSTSSKLFRVDMPYYNVREVKDANIQLQNDWFNYIYDIFFDGNNNIWLGTRKGVAYTKNAIPFFVPYYISADQTAMIDHAFYIYPCHDTIAYACTETGLLAINTNTNEIESLDKGRKYYFITEHTDKNMLVSNEDSFFVYQPTDKKFFEVSVFYPELKSLAGTSVNSITYANDSVAVIGTQTGSGFYSWNYKKKTLIRYTAPQPVDAAEANIVNTTYKDKQKRVWVLGNKWVTLYTPATGAAQSIKLVNRNTHTDYTLFLDVCEAGGYFWMAAYGSGLIQLDHNFTIKRVFTTKDGLSNAGIYKIFPVHDSLIYMSTNYGLSVLNLRSRAISTYYKEDGLQSNAFEQGCGAYTNGKIYVGGINGFTVVDPDYFATNKNPPVLYLNHVRMETASGFIDKSNQSLKMVEIPEDEMQTTFTFSALNYSSPSRIRYAYKIEGVNNSWIHLGNQNSISLMKQNPGQYTLQVISANENNVWNKKPWEIILVYMPKWYQTVWFKIGVIAIILALLYAFYAYRIGQLKKQQQIRKDIAADLHDDIGSILNTVKVFAHLARKEPGSEKYLIQIEESLTQAAIAFRDMLWILDDSHDTVYEFAERIKKYVIPVTSATGINSSFVIDPNLNDGTLSKAEKRNILLIVKECINNCIKYAECKNISIVIKQLNKKMAILIHDDGNGFNVHAPTGGMGLKNIRYRAKQIGYDAEFISSPQDGTLVKVAKK